MTTMTTDELNRLFAEREAGWSRKPQFDYHTGYEGRLVEMWGRDTGELIPAEKLPDYCASADAVLPWLMAGGVWAAEHAFDGVDVVVCDANGQEHRAKAPTFAEAAVRALLRAKGALMR